MEMEAEAEAEASVSPVTLSTLPKITARNGPWLNPGEKWDVKENVRPFTGYKSSQSSLWKNDFADIGFSEGPMGLNRGDRHVPTPPPNTEFNSVFRQRLKMRLAPKLTPII